MSDLSKVEYGLTDQKKVRLLQAKTPERFIKERTGRGNMKFKYVETGYIIKCLNEIFNYMWSFEVKEKTINQSLTQVQVLGKLTGYVVIPSPNGQNIVQPVVKEQYGGSDIKKWSGTAASAGSPIDIGDDFKAAASDALKKCASMMGIAEDVYWKGADKEDRVSTPVADVFPPIKKAEEA